MSPIRFVPSLLFVDAAVGVANISYGFTEFNHFSDLVDNVVPVIIDTPYNILEVRTHACKLAERFCFSYTMKLNCLLTNQAHNHTCMLIAAPNPTPPHPL